MDDKISKKSSMLTQLISDIAYRVTCKILRDEQSTNMLACIVASYDSGRNTATLYMPPDYITAGVVRYINHTNSQLSVGDKVYLLYKYGDVSQGWIAHKSDGSHLICGIYSATGLTQDDTYSFIVPFNKTYTGVNLPQVLITINTDVPQNVHASVNSITATGFTLAVNRVDAVDTLDVSWLAIGG
jgi:hypothetical protein